jgi:prolyl 4-hydroxylase
MTTIDGRWMTVVDGVLTAEECRHFIALLDRPEELVAVDRGFANYDRNILVSAEWAGRIFERIRGVLPAGAGTGDLKTEIYLNDHFRFSKYRPGQSFHIHRDGFNADASGGRSFMTVNIFLNDDFLGGETAFYDGSREVLRARPAPGRGAIFDGQIYHAGLEVREGYKYLLRTDLMMRFIRF